MTSLSQEGDGNILIHGNYNSVHIGAPSPQIPEGSADKAAQAFNRWLECMLPTTLVLLLWFGLTNWRTTPGFDGWASNWHYTIAMPLLGGAVAGVVILASWELIDRLRSRRN
jgi:hypothetical protein